LKDLENVKHATALPLEIQNSNSYYPGQEQQEQERDDAMDTDSLNSLNWKSLHEYESNETSILISNLMKQRKVEQDSTELSHFVKDMASIINELLRHYYSVKDSSKATRICNVLLQKVQELKPHQGDPVIASILKQIEHVVS
jgi:hypothetical protein